MREGGMDGWRWNGDHYCKAVLSLISLSPLFFLVSSSSGIKLSLVQGSQCLVKSCLGSIVWLLLDPNADRLHMLLCSSGTQMHTSTQQNAIWQRVQVVLSWRGWGGWWGREFALWKVPTDSIALSEMLSLMIRESAACEWALRQRYALALAYLFPALFHSLVFLFSCCLSLGPNLLCRCLLGGCECVLYVWWWSVDRDGWVKMCWWISAKPAEGWGSRDSLFFVDEKQHWIPSPSAWHQGTSQVASSPWLY